MKLPEPLRQFLDQRIERLAAPLCIEYDRYYCVEAWDGPAARYGLQEMVVGEVLPEALDFLQGMDQGEPLSLAFVTLPTGVVAHIDLRQHEQRRFILLIDATEQHNLVQAQQQQANELRLLTSHQQRTLEQLSQAKAAIEAQRAELELLNQAQARYIAMMSHEFRTPLNAIMGYGELLRDSLQADSAAPQHPGLPHLAAIRRSTWHLLTMVENVLEQARLGRGQVTLTQEPAALSELIQLLQDLFQGQAEEKSLTLHFAPSADLPEQLLLDVVRVRQIAINLIGNALRYTPKGRVEARFDYQDGRLIIQVQDSGPGIAMVDQERIFRPYERGAGAAGGGAGLGLAICRQLAEMMGGSLSLLSEAGEGACFTFSVPAQLPGKQPEVPLFGHVLVLDDDPDLRQWLQIVLNGWGLETTALASLAEMRGWIQERDLEGDAATLPDLFITDYLLEDGVGVEAMKSIRERDASLPVVMLTGSVPADEGVRMTHDPHFLLLAKPISSAALRHSLAKMLPESRHTAHKENHESR